MAPEVRAAPGSEGIGQAADVWSFGATLYEAITGGRVTEDPAPLAEDLPAGLASLVMRMLAGDPAERPRPSEVATVLESFV
jgi:serine/threonine protein kinase